MSLSPGSILPRDLDSRQYAIWAAAQQAIPYRDVKTFTPTWDGFSVDPVGDISYVDLGALVILQLTSALTGTADSNVMRITNLPSGLRPPDLAGGFSRVLLDEGSGMVNFPGVWGYASGTNLLGFGSMNVASAPGTVLGNFTVNAANSKGLPAGWFIIYPKGI